MRKILILFIILLPFTAFGQYPIPVRKGDTLKIVKKETVDFIAVKDTLWILKNSQLQNAIIKANKLELCEEQTTEYKNLVKLLKEQGAEKDSLSTILKKDWEICEKDIVKMDKLQQRQSLYTKIAVISIPVAFLIGLFINL